tara:strand:+ start:169 stop:1917 length:1749 start_codon:yes stop_codon:yes gene_type:complete
MSFSSVSGKNWLFKKFDTTDITNFSESLSITEILAKLLAIRKKKIGNIKLFLDPKIKNLLPNPNSLKDMQNAIDRTYQSIINKETIGIFGDYDVDGASSTAILARYFSLIKKNFKIYIPDRQKEGYGPSTNAFEKLIKSDSKIIFTVDCGTLSFKAIDFAKKYKVDVVVLDHHQSDIKLPSAFAIVNPNRYDDKSGLNYLCAAGVCFLFLVGLNKKLRDENWFKSKNINEPDVLSFLDLVSLGTVCDVVPLIGLNRAIVKQGLKVIKSRSNLGIKTLYDLCKTEAKPNTYDIGYVLGPRINAGGRVGKSSHGAELLISEDPHKAYQIATDLDKSNNERKSIEMLLIEKINTEVKKFHNHPVLVLSGNSWHEGIIGIVAARIKEKYNKPTIIISLKNKMGKGSARSIFGFDIGSEIIKCVQLNILEKGGGHKMAGGFTIKEENIPSFRDKLINNFEKLNKNDLQTKDLFLDSIIAPSALNEDFFQQISLLEPFGSGNKEPTFVIENLKVISSRVIKNNHIKSILIGKDGSKLKSIAWNAISSPLEPYLSKSKERINIAGKLRLNEWRGEKQIEFDIEDICLAK